MYEALGEPFAAMQHENSRRSARIVIAPLFDQCGPRAIEALTVMEPYPVWRRPVLTLLWALAGLGIALALPGAVVDVAYDVMRLVVGQRVSLSGIGAAVVALGVATWAAAALALRDD